MSSWQPRNENGCGGSANGRLAVQGSAGRGMDADCSAAIRLSIMELAWAGTHTLAPTRVHPRAGGDEWHPIILVFTPANFAFSSLNLPEVSVYHRTI
eukprot:COSAG02_NODE_6801_length_3352_cov_170.007378_4_plen_97_part_00